MHVDINKMMIQEAHTSSTANPMSVYGAKSGLPLAVTAYGDTWGGFEFRPNV
jgi:hypothetical protein